MLKNYEKLQNGVIKQINKNPIKYGLDYTNGQNKYGIEKYHISYLRLGYIIGTLGKIPSTILDVGYGQGHFLEIARNIVPNCYGNDITTECAMPQGCEFISDIYEKEYEVITFFDVLEHFNNIYDIKNLKTEYIVVSVPWCLYLNDEWFYNWKHRKTDEHLWHFNEKSLIEFMQEIGFECLNYCNLEDTIRKDKINKPNILTAIFKKINEK